jgi:small conductance mechanosensitive channel
MLKIICFFISFSMINSLVGQEKVKDKKSSETVELSGAEIIIGLQKAIANDQQRLIKMNSRSKKLEFEIVQLTSLYEKMDTQLELSNGAAANNQNEKMEQVLSSLDFHLRSRQAILKQIVLVQSKIEKQKELVNYVSNGPSPASEVKVSPSFSIDTTAQAISNSETQNRIELAALEEVQILDAKLMHNMQNLSLVDQLIRNNKEDLELTKLLKEATTGLRDLLSTQSQTIAVKQHLLEVSRRFTQDTLLLSSLNMRIEDLERHRPWLIEAVTQAEKRVEKAKSELEFLQSSIAPDRVLYWLKTKLPSIAIIVLVFLSIWALARWIIKFILNKFIKSRGNKESADRLETLKLASGSIITILVVVIGFLVILSQIGVDLTVVLGGAAVLSLVIALGAQSLVKDYLSGFIILLENQYRAGNVVKINETTGVVENMSLRLTVLRDLEGITHFIPHGHIDNVSNLTHNWSRVMLEIGVSYKEDVDKVMAVLLELGTQLIDDKEFGSLIIGEMEMLGVDKFADSAIVIKLLIKTYPLKQWIIKREMLRRIKNKFDELGIEIPFPHLTVYHRKPEEQLLSTS